MCPKCNSNLQYIEFADAYACPQCNSWEEKKCDDIKCLFCVGRPEQPFSECCKQELTPKMGCFICSKCRHVNENRSYK